jgi:hypothetical protein
VRAGSGPVCANPSANRDAPHSLRLEVGRLARVLIHGGDALRIELRELWHHLLKGARKERQKSRTLTWDSLLAAWLTPAIGPLH